MEPDGTSSHARAAGVQLEAPPTNEPTLVGPTASRLPQSLKAFRIHPESDGRKPRSLLDITRRLLYVRYKTCDRRIEEKLTSMVPFEIYQPKKHGISAITKATDYIVEQALPVDRAFFNDLKELIRDRRNMAIHEYHGGDEGHAHVIEVLEYCWTRLVPLRKVRETIVGDGPREEDVNALCNQFDTLASEYNDTDSDTDDDEMDLPQGTRPRPKDTLPSLHAATLSDRRDVASFINTLEGLMFFTASQYKMMVGLAQGSQSIGLHPSINVVKTLETAVATNIAIQQVAALEQIFMEEHPHLNTAYRMMASLFFADHVQLMHALVAVKSPLASQFTDQDAIAFLGDAMEDSFRDRFDTNNKARTLVPDFLARWQFTDDELVTVLEGVHANVLHTYTRVRLHTDVEIARPEDMIENVVLADLSEKCGCSNHTSKWLPGEYIGRNRSILYTFRHLQRYSMLIKENKYYKKGVFGGAWGERTEPATRIQLDMDELLMHDILPSLINMCLQGFMSGNLIHQDELLAGFVQMKKFANSPECTVSWSLAFTIHAILTSILETQECQEYLATTSQVSFLTFIQQLNSAEKLVSAIPRQLPHWDNLGRIQDLQLLARVNISRTRQQILLSLWNPYCAGSILSYLAYHGNVAGGTTLINSVGQLRMTLHLFNALQQIGAIKPGEIIPLDGIFQSFKHCATLWRGVIPIQGQFQSRWKKVILTDWRNMEFADLSESFRRICLLEFRDTTRKRRSRNRAKKYAHLEPGQAR